MKKDNLRKMTKFASLRQSMFVQSFLVMFTQLFFAESFIKSYPVNAKNEKFYCLSQR